MRIKLLAVAVITLIYQIHNVAGLPDDPAAKASDETVLVLSDSESPNEENAVADEPTSEEDQPQTKPSEAPINIAMKTAGGGQFWTDHIWRRGFHIQQNVLTGHWRLLDAKNVRQGWGNKAQCLAKLDELCPKDSDAKTGNRSKHVVVLLHGLMRTSGSMKPLATELESKGYEVVTFSYASTRAPIGEHAAALREVIEDFPEDTEFSFSGHSMGNIIVRHLIGDLERDEDPEKILPRCRSMVMLGPPNQGAAIARKMAKTGLFGLVTGKGGMELGPHWNTLIEKLATPSFPFAIVAGDRSDSKVQNPLVGDKSDFVVSLEEAHLDGVDVLKTVSVLHSFLMSDEDSMKFTVDYICENHPVEK